MKHFSFSYCTWIITLYASYKFNAKKALKHTYQLRCRANTVRTHTNISPGQWQPWTAVSLFLGLISIIIISLTCDHAPCLFLPRQMHKHPFTHQLHTKHVVAVGWELKNSSPMACIIIEMGSMSSPTFDRVGKLE